MKYARGLHEIRGIGSLSAVSPAGARGRLSAKLSRLDHQRALLERQLAVWDEKQRVTKYRLGLLAQEITELGRSTREVGAPSSGADQRKQASSSKSEAQARGYAAARRSVVSLEY
jgi:hypothetical protein